MSREGALLTTEIVKRPVVVEEFDSRLPAFVLQPRGIRRGDVAGDRREDAPAGLEVFLEPIEDGGDADLIPRAVD